jgi:hypothetical protein
MDEDVQIKDYSPYKRLNRFREWLNAFQAKQSPDIDDQVFKDIIVELNKKLEVLFLFMIFFSCNCKTDMQVIIFEMDATENNVC